MNQDFVITESTFGYKLEDDLFGVEIKTGEFTGIKYTYGTLRFPDEENENGEYVLSFDYTVREGKVDENATKRFESVISDVLNSVLLDSLQQAEKRYTNETRNTNSETSDIE